MKYSFLNLSTATLAALIITSSSTTASDLSTEEILEVLAPKKILTRSLNSKPKPKMENADSEFLNSLGKTRGIKFIVKDGSSTQHQEVTDYKQPTYKKEEIEKVVEITKIYEMPKLEFTINFEFGSAQVSGESLINVINLAKALAHPSMADTRIILGGHTDAKGSSAFNQILSQKRSDSVAQLVAKIGEIHANRIIPIGYGEHQLKNPHDPHADENRRVEIINISSF